MKLKHLFVLSLFMISAFTLAQLQMFGVRERKPGEISYETAVVKMTEIIVRLGFEAPTAVEEKCRIVRRPANSEYDLRTKGGDWSCTVDAISGRIKSLLNRKRHNDQYKNRGRTGGQKFPSEQAAKNHLRTVATKLGVPASASLTHFGWKKDGEVRDANSSGAVYANYRIPGREVFIVEVDPQDGVFIFFQHIVKPQ